MSHRGNLINIGSKKIFLVRGIFDYFDKKNFTRLMEEYKDAKENNAELYVGLYSDDILNSILIEKYNVKILEKIKDKVFFKDGDTKILSKELAEKTIELSSDNLLEKIKKEILDTEYTEKWDKIRKLKRLD